VARVVFRHDRVMPLTALPADVAAKLRGADFSYSEVGLTAGALPPGYRHLRCTTLIGAGPEVFAEAASSLLHWQVHLRAGLRVSPSSATAVPGTVVLLALGAGPIQITAPCRVVYVVNDPGRQGFAYGTLPGHPERGEQAFIIEQHHDGAVSFTVTAFSRPATRLVKAAGPAGQAIQRYIIRRFLRALTD
jgi:uncharacterized protein (UPF0548 family)